MESIGDYLESIYKLTSQKEKKIKLENICNSMKISKEKLLDILKELEKKDFLKIDNDNNISFTKKGENFIHYSKFRKDFLTKFFYEVLYVPYEIAEKDAQSIVHHISLETIDKMVAFFEYIRYCPYAKEDILKKFKKCCVLSNENNDYCRSHEKCPFFHKVKKIKKLTDLKPGEKGKILRLTAKGAIRRRLIDMGVLPDVLVEMQSVAPLGDPIKIKMKGYYLSLRKSEAEGILLKNDENIN